MMNMKNMMNWAAKFITSSALKFNLPDDLNENYTITL